MQLLIVTRERQGDFRFGLGKAVRRIAAELRSRGHSVDLISVAEWTTMDSVRHQRATHVLQRMTAPEPLASALAERWVQARRTRKLLQKKTYTHLWFQDPWLAIAFLFLRPFNQVSRSVRWGLSEHGYGTFAHAVMLDGLVLPQIWRRLLLWLESLCLRSADFVLLPTLAVDFQLRDELKFEKTPGNWTVLGYGRPMELPMSRSQARNVLGWDEASFYALVLGRTAPVKRIDVILNACLVAQSKGVEVHLVIVGGGLNAALRALADSLRIQPICVQVDDPSPFLAAADVYLSACAVESFGLANLEAIAAGLPSVVARGGGASEVLADGAWLIEPTPENFAQALNHLVNQPALRAHWAKAASDRTAKIPTWKQLVPQYEGTIVGDHG